MIGDAVWWYPYNIRYFQVHNSQTKFENVLKLLIKSMNMLDTQIHSLMNKFKFEALRFTCSFQAEHLALFSKLYHCTKPSMGIRINIEWYDSLDKLGIPILLG